MGVQLNAINNFCEDALKKGKIIPLSFEFPSFKINEAMFIDAAKEVVHEKVGLSIISGKYGHPILENISIQDLVNAQIAKSENKATMEQNGQNIFSEKILPIQMMKDSNLDYNEISKKTLSEICESRLKYSFANIEASMGPYDDEYSKTMMHKNKFVATMLMLKEMIPTSYRQINLALREHPNQLLVSELKKMEESPDITIVKHIMDIDNKFAEKNFPKEYKYLADEEKFANEFIPTKLKFA